MVKIITAKQAIDFIKSSQTLMIGGFLNCGSPNLVIDEIIKTDLHDFTLIANDTSLQNTDRGKLITAHKIKKAIVSHIGTNPETMKQMNNAEIEIEFIPQGTLAERIRAGGAGLGGILTPVGIGTEIENNKQIIKVDNKNYILEKPIKADIAIIYATYADKYGNLSFYGSTRNFNAIMPMAAEITIVEVDNFSDEPLDPNNIAVPGIFVDYMIIRNK